MQPRTNRQWILKGRPKGMVEPSLFEARESTVPPLEDGQILVQTHLLSFDPTQRAWMALDTYLPKVELGDVMRAGGIAQVIESRHRKYVPGDLVYCFCGWQEYVVLEPEQALVRITKIPGFLDPALTLALSLTGLTAYFGLLDIGKTRPGDTVLVSGAAGATGSVAAQIARIKGCRVIGIAGGEAKCAWLIDTAKLDAAIDYKSENLGKRLGELCPDGIDVYFDNVGGPMLDEVLLHLATKPRIVLCGAISQYNALGEPYGLKNTPMLIVRRGTARGFIVLDHMKRALEGLLVLNKWVRDGKLVQEIDLQHGFDQIPATLVRLFTGANLGKQLLEVSDPPLPVRTSRVGEVGFRAMSAFTAWRKG